MRKMYKFENIDCAHCALKIQEEIKKINGVKNCVLNFLAQKMVLEYDLVDKEKIIAEINKVAKQTAPDFVLYV